MFGNETGKEKERGKVEKQEKMKERERRKNFQKQSVKDNEDTIEDGNLLVRIDVRFSV